MHQPAAHSIQDSVILYDREVARSNCDPSAMVKTM